MTDFNLGDKVRLVNNTGYFSNQEAFGVEGYVGEDYDPFDAPYEGENIFIIPTAEAVAERGDYLRHVTRGFYWHTDDLEKIDG